RTGNEEGGSRNRLLRSQVQALAFVELENQEVNGAWWLPGYQRIEMQVAVTMLGDTRSAIRVVSRFRDYAVDATGDETRIAALARGDSTADPAQVDAPEMDTLHFTQHRLSWAPKDSASSFSQWAAEIGEGTASGRMDDFNDVAPDRWRPTGRPRFDWRVARPSDAVHFTR